MRIDWDMIFWFSLGWSVATIARRWIGRRYNIEWMKV